MKRGIVRSTSTLMEGRGVPQLLVIPRVAESQDHEGYLVFTPRHRVSSGMEAGETVLLQYKKIPPSVSPAPIQAEGQTTLATVSPTTEPILPPPANDNGLRLPIYPDDEDLYEELERFMGPEEMNEGAFIPEIPRVTLGCVEGLPYIDQREGEVRVQLHDDHLEGCGDDQQWEQLENEELAAGEQNQSFLQIEILVDNTNQH